MLDGGDYADALYGGAGDDEIYEGYWFFTDIFVGSAGNDVLFGEAGTDTFLFEQGTGGDVIADFIQGKDTIDISAFDFASFEALQTTFVQNGDVGAINLGNGDFLVFHNVVLDDLVEGDFLL